MLYKVRENFKKINLIDKYKIRDKIKSLNFVFNDYYSKNYCNDVIYFTFNDGKYFERLNDIDFIDDLSINNIQTRRALSYNNFKTFVDYIMNHINNNYYNYNITDNFITKITTKTDLEIREELTEWICNEIEQAVNIISAKYRKKNKVDSIRKKMNQIENDIDFKIVDLSEKYVKSDWKFNESKPTEKKWSKKYSFFKEFIGYCGLYSYHLLIYKDVSSRYYFSYTDIDGHFTKIQPFKKDITSDKIEKFIGEILEPYSIIPKIKKDIDINEYC